MAGGARKQPIKQPTEMPTSTMALKGRFPSLMGCFLTLMGRFADFVLRCRFASWKSIGKQPSKKRGIKRLLINRNFQSWLENFNLDRRFQSQSKFSIRGGSIYGALLVLQRRARSKISIHDRSLDIFNPEGRDRTFSIPGPSGKLGVQTPSLFCVTSWALLGQFSGNLLQPFSGDFRPFQAFLGNFMQF